MPPFFARLETSPIMRGGQKQRPNAGILDPANLGGRVKTYDLLDVNGNVLDMYKLIFFTLCHSI